MGRLQTHRIVGLNPLVVLGATGSIGEQTLDVAQRLGIPVAAVAAARGSEALHSIASLHPEAVVAVASPTPSERERFTQSFGKRVAFGPEAVADLARRAGHTVVNGIVGAAGLPSSLAALEAGNRLALANKESLVAAGPVMKAALARGGGELIPVDSEHSAIWQCLVGETTGDVSRLILTASGGPFRGKTIDDLEGVTVAEALDHPTWSMGPRITIDSATLMNKAFEVIEAHMLFDLSYDDINVVVHPQSIVHSLVEFRDGAIKAELGSADMRGPIQYAITYPDRQPLEEAPFDLTATPLEFFEPDRVTFPCLDLGYAAGRAGGSAPAVLNAADEVAVHAFLQGQIGFTSIARVVERTLDRCGSVPIESLEDVLDADDRARGIAREALGVSC